MINDHGYDGNHVNGIIDLNDKVICVGQSFLQWALHAQWIAYNLSCSMSVLHNNFILLENELGTFALM